MVGGALADQSGGGSYCARNAWIRARANCVAKLPQLASNPWSAAGSMMTSPGTLDVFIAAASSAPCSSGTMRSLVPKKASVGGERGETNERGDSAR